MKNTNNILNKYVLPLAIGTTFLAGSAFAQDSNKQQIENKPKIITPTVVGMNGYRVKHSNGLLTKKNKNGVEDPFIKMTGDTLAMINNYIRVKNPDKDYSLEIFPIVAEDYKVSNNKVIAGKNADEGLFGYILINNTGKTHSHPNWLKKTYFNNADCIDNRLHVKDGDVAESGLFILDKDGKIDTDMMDKLKGLVQEYKIANDSLNSALIRSNLKVDDLQDLLNITNKDNYCCDSTLAALQDGFLKVSSSLNSITSALQQQKGPKGHFYVGVTATDLKGIGGVLGYSGNKKVAPFIEGEIVADEELNSTVQENQYNGFGSEDIVNTDYVIEQARAMVNAGIQIPLVSKGQFSFNVKPSVGAGYVFGNSIGTTDAVEIEGFEGLMDAIPNKSEILTEKYGKLVTQGKLELSAKIKNFEVGVAYVKMLGSVYDTMNEGSNHMIKQSKFLNDNSFLQGRLAYHFGKKR